MKRRNKVFKFEPGLDKAYRQLFGSTSPVGCSVCGDDDLDTLDIHKIDGSPGLQVLCRDWHDKIIINNCNLSEKYNTIQEGITR